MIMGCLSISLCLLQLVSSKIYSFCYNYLSPLWPDLFLSISYSYWKLDFFFSQSILAHNNSTNALHIDFVSHNFAKFISSNSFLVESLRFPFYKIISSANGDSLMSSFLVCVPFISSSCLISLARTSGIMLSKNSGSTSSKWC